MKKQIKLKKPTVEEKNRLKAEKTALDFKYERKQLAALRKELAEKDMELNSRLQKQHEFQMKMMEELKDNKAVVSDLNTYKELKETLKNIKGQEAEMARAMSEKSRLMLDYGNKEKGYIEQIRELKNRIAELTAMSRSKDNEAREIVRKFDKEKDYHIRRELDVRKLELERDLEAKHSQKTETAKREFDARIQRLMKDQEEIIKRYEETLKEKEHSLLDALTKSEKVIKSKEVDVLAALNESSKKLFTQQLESEKKVSKLNEEIQGLQAKLNKTVNESETLKSKDAGRIKILEEQLKLKESALDKLGKENELRMIELQKKAFKTGDDMDLLYKAKIDEMTKSFWQEKEEILRKYEGKMRDQLEYSSAMLAEKDRIISSKNNEMLEAVSERSKKESELKFAEDKLRSVLDEKSGQSVTFIQENDRLQTKVKHLEKELEGSESDLRKIRSENDEQRLKLEAIEARADNYKFDKKTLIVEIEEEYNKKMSLLKIESAAAQKNLEAQLKNSSNEFKDMLYGKDLKIANLQKEISELRTKKQKGKELDKDALSEAVEKALRFEKKVNEELNNNLRIKETELKKIKESKYLNEDAVKKELNEKNIETGNVKKEYQLRLDDSEKKFKKEKELLEQYLKTAKEETEKLRKEIAIKNMLSNL
ncbi:MAG: hypothetical protein A2231_09790 [Candidatus Firestonebacteria bacterium RIFOXYA2_FULL_40_8]|nr:MAG: hypothetical protein A2231_09790 [Candidatus Firestonebacteria bacterium RIFOXYA2_FULL_40_8]